MKSEDKNLKIPTSFRLDPELKKDLEQEAADHNQTTSSYIETIVNSRHLIGFEDMPFGNYREMVITIGELTNEVNAINKSRDKLRQKLDSKKELTKELKREIVNQKNITTDLQNRSLTFEGQELINTIKLIEELKTVFSERTNQRIVIASLKAAIDRYENSIFSKGLDSFFEED